jgi:hypothetical protein
MPATHLLVSISAHGYGHLTQVVPIINSLMRQIPGLQLTLRTDLPDEVLRSRIHGDYNLQTDSDDFGLVMFDAVRVDGKASFTRYCELHANWEKRVDACAKDLESSGANLVLADVPYLTLAAAKKVRIPALAICSLNWFDIASSYLPENQIASNILESMVEAYQGADVFLQPEPSMPMHWLGNRKAIGPVASPGTRQREVLQKMAGIQPDEQVLLIAMGGVPIDLDIGAWKPRHSEHLLIPPGWPIKHERVHHYTDLGLNFQDILASSDLVITKSGYGTFVEAAAAGLPVFHLRRPDWPEGPYLETWLDSKVNQQGIDAETFNLSTAIEACEQLLVRGKRSGTTMDGVAQACDVISEFLVGR